MKSVLWDAGDGAGRRPAPTRETGEVRRSEGKEGETTEGGGEGGVEARPARKPMAEPEGRTGGALLCGVA